ncbi:DsbA family protein [Mycolicibacterium palauense]|uniref:DsbA family protein n=1 Tax=Mycolicibacterium palauense TaxID=2034511 RepID=UPI00159BA961|nr:thioredoxin domain-containing protein [Mycolicibacterium palauense]
MRLARHASAAALCAAVALGLVATGCSNVIEGTPRADPRTPGVALTDDGFGVVAGFDDAPVHLEIFTEPQCTHCADLQHDYGEEIRSHLQAGRLAVTYRPLTFFDEEYYLDYSALVSNALFLAVAPSTSAGDFQTFVEDLWANQDLSYIDYTDADFAEIAEEAGLAAPIVEDIDSGARGVRVQAMSDANTAALMDITGGRAGTPTIYDLDAREVVDVSEPDWLENLIASA